MPSDHPVPYGIGSDTWPGLSRLAAEAAQVVRFACTIIGTGDDTHQDAAVQRESLQDELGDLRAAIDYVIGKNDLDWGAVNKRRDRKRSLYERGIDEDRPPSRDQQDRDAPDDRPGPHAHSMVGNGYPRSAPARAPVEVGSPIRSPPARGPLPLVPSHPRTRRARIGSAAAGAADHGGEAPS